MNPSLRAETYVDAPDEGLRSDEHSCNSRRKHDLKYEDKYIVQ